MGVVNTNSDKACALCRFECEGGILKYCGLGKRGSQYLTRCKEYVGAFLTDANIRAGKDALRCEKFGKSAAFKGYIKVAAIGGRGKANTHASLAQSAQKLVCPRLCRDNGGIKAMNIRGGKIVELFGGARNAKIAMQIGNGVTENHGAHVGIKMFGIYRKIGVSKIAQSQKDKESTSVPSISKIAP